MVISEIAPPCSTPSLTSLVSQQLVSQLLIRSAESAISDMICCVVLSNIRPLASHTSAGRRRHHRQRTTDESARHVAHSAIAGTCAPRLLEYASECSVVCTHRLKVEDHKKEHSIKSPWQHVTCAVETTSRRCQ